MILYRDSGDWEQARPVVVCRPNWLAHSLRGGRIERADLMVATLGSNPNENCRAYPYLEQASNSGLDAAFAFRHVHRFQAVCPHQGPKQLHLPRALPYSTVCAQSRIV